MEKNKNLMVFTNYVQKFCKLIRIKPESLFKMIWDSIVIILLFINILYVPVSIAFNIEENGSDGSDGMQNSDTNRVNSISSDIALFLSDIPTAVFVIDLFFGFITEYYERGILVDNFYMIVKSYSRKYLLWDSISIIPFLL